MRKMLVALMVVGLPPAGGSAAEGLMTGKDLRDLCGSSHVVTRAICHAYVQGVVEAASKFSTEGFSCLPGVDMNALRLDFLKQVRLHPAMLKEPVLDALLTAIVLSYDCGFEEVTKPPSGEK